MSQDSKTLEKPATLRELANQAVENLEKTRNQIDLIETAIRGTQPETAEKALYHNGLEGALNRIVSLSEECADRLAKIEAAM